MLEPCQGAADTDFLLALPHGRPGRWVGRVGAGGWQARPCPAGWDLGGPAPGDGVTVLPPSPQQPQDRAATDSRLRRAALSRLCSLPLLGQALCSEPVLPTLPGLATRGRCLPPGPSPHCRRRRAEQGLCAWRRAVSPHLTVALHGTLRPLRTRGPGLQVRLPSVHSLPPSSHACPVPTHMAHAHLGRLRAM